MSLIGSPLRSSRNSSLSSGRTVRLDHPTNEDGMGPQIQVHTENSLEEMTPRAPRARTRTQESTMEPVGEEEGVCQVESHDGEQTDAPEPGGLPPLDLTESLGTAESLALPLTTGPSVQAANSEVAALEAAASPAVLSKTKKKATVEKLMHQWYTAMTSAMK
ncbi:hypothetical protein FA95DRAFT_904166 [Auriscalpium vulgare]|uniref:Uncharacterized protein n=1 Tax=Auriscalpium vulgare TaxID=40419 RepID=A0ACB8R8G1_9AGAM|nr:hypothetical protein FA95DRAFT_904166 [Auriscalpium vulgare]